MKISLQWLKEYIDYKFSAQELSHRLTLSGLEVEKEEVVDGDTVFELEITPNRPDCLSLLGIGRELSAILNKPLKKPAVKKLKKPQAKAKITIADAKDCSRYIGAVFNNVSVAPASKDIQGKLSSLGFRCVNNVVDITNFCLMECGQPMHAFDFDKLEGGKIIVRRAKAGEKIVAINDVEYTLDPSILVIADTRRVVAIAGIMGGKETEVTEKTKNVLLESAFFDPLLVRRASRKLALRSDASYRFERGVDMAMVEQGCCRAIDLICASTGARFFSFGDAYPGKTKKQKPLEIAFDPQKASHFLGTPLSASQVKNILTKLEFNVSPKAKGMLKITPPSFRADVKTAIDVVEEVGRVMGFDRLSLRLAAINPVNIETDKKRLFKEKLSSLLVAQGCKETISYTTLSLKDLDSARVSRQGLVCNQNFLTEDQEVLRPSLLPSLLRVMGHNFKNGQKDLRLFEVGKIYLSTGEEDVFALGVTGRQPHDWRFPQPREVDFYDIKGVEEQILKTLRVHDVDFVPAPNPSFDQDQSVKIVCGGKEIGVLGKVKREILGAWDIKHQDVFFSQVLLECLWQREDKKKVSFVALNAYPGVGRDISLALKKEISYQQVREAILTLREPLLKNIDIVEQYLGDKIPSGQKGLTISLLYQSADKTLTDNEVEQVHQRICQSLLSKLQAVKR